MAGDPAELVAKCDSDAKDTLNTAFGYGGSTDWSDLSTFNVPAVRVSSGRPTGRSFRCRRRRYCVAVSFCSTRRILIPLCVGRLLLSRVAWFLVWCSRVDRLLRDMLIWRMNVLILATWTASGLCCRR